MNEKAEGPEAGQADELERLAVQIESEGPGESPGVEGDYIPGDDQSQGQPKTADILAPMLQITFGLLAAKRGPHWKLSDLEAVEAARAYGDVIDKYWPDAAIGPEAAAVLVTLAVFGPRVMQDKKLEAEKAKQEKPGADDGEKAE